MLRRRDFLKGMLASGIGMNIMHPEGVASATGRISGPSALSLRGCELSTIVRILRKNFIRDDFIEADAPMELSADALWIDASGELSVLFITFCPKTEAEARRIRDDLKEDVLYGIQGRYEYLKDFGAHYLHEARYQAVPLDSCGHERELLFSGEANRMIAERESFSEETAKLLAEVDSSGWPKEAQDIIRAEILGFYGRL